MKDLGEYWLQTISIKNFKQIKFIEIESLPYKAPWIFITGENGFGKTVFLQALATALSPIDDVINESLALVPAIVRAEVSLHGPMVFGATYRSGKLQIHRNSNFKYLCCYGSSRLLFQSESDQTEKTINSSSLGRLFYTQTFLKNIEFELLRLSLKVDSQSIPIEEKEFIRNKLRNTINLLKQILNLNDIILDIRKDVVLYSERGEENESFEPIKKDQLSAGYRSILGFVGDMLLKLFYLQPKVVDPKELVGIVLIDEFELHLHPKWQKSLPSILSKSFPKIQFIASTHSPIPLLGAPEGSVFLKILRNVEKGVRLERLIKLEKEIQFLLPNSVFTSDIFDLEEIESSQNKNVDAIELEDRYKNISVNEEIRNKLNNSDPEIFPNNLFDKQ